MASAHVRSVVAVPGHIGGSVMPRSVLEIPVCNEILLQAFGGAVIATSLLDAGQVRLEVAERAALAGGQISEAQRECGGREGLSTKTIHVPQTKTLDVICAQ